MTVQTLFFHMRRLLDPERDLQLPSRTQAGARVYAIGDIHGHRAELDGLLEEIASDMEEYGGDTTLVFLGDYIDRGPDSRGVIERLVDGALPGDRHIFLRGNHEAVLLDIVDGHSPNPRDWLLFGGVEMLASYGVTRDKLLAGDISLSKLVRDIVPETHLQFVRDTELSHEHGDYLFVHAGVRPGVPLDRQDARDLMWIRQSFLASKAHHGKTIVHGHTIEANPQSHAHRIGVDTGCYAGGALSAVRLEGETRDFISIPNMAENQSW